MILRNSKIKDPAPLWATTIQVPPLSSSAPSTELPSARRCRMLIQTSSCNSTDATRVEISLPPTSRVRQPEIYPFPP